VSGHNPLRLHLFSKQWPRDLCVHLFGWFARTHRGSFARWSKNPGAPVSHDHGTIELGPVLVAVEVSMPARPFNAAHTPAPNVEILLHSEVYDSIAGPPFGVRVHGQSRRVVDLCVGAANATESDAFWLEFARAHLPPLSLDEVAWVASGQPQTRSMLAMGAHQRIAISGMLCASWMAQETAFGYRVISFL
jgi:hypothetical protein